MAVESDEDRGVAVEDASAELARVQAERDKAVAALDRRGRRERRLARVRRGLVGAMVGVFAILLPVTVMVGWAHNTILNTGGWTRTVGPIAADPAVQAAISTQVTNQIFTSLDAQGQIANALPDRAAFLAAPLTNGVKGYVENGVNKVITSDQFQTFWLQANTFAHQQLVKVLRGDSKALTTTNGQVVLNLVPLVNAALQQMEGFVSGVVGKPVTLPAISGNELPAAACQRISTALNRPLPATCGQIPLFPADKLTQAQRIVRAFDRLTLTLLVVTPVLAAGALWLSRRRRRTLLQLSVAGMLGLVVARRATWWLMDSLVNTGRPENKAARQAILDHATHAFFTVSLWIAIGVAVVFAVTLVTGPYQWARGGRRYVADAGRKAGSLAAATVGRARDESTVAWVRSHLGPLRVGGFVVAALLMIVISVSFVGFLIIGGLLALYELWLYRLQEHAGPPPVTPATPV